MADDQLEPLITECPNCATRFRVTESQLEVASGRVRCGACLTVFQGTEHLLWEGGEGYQSARQAAAALDDLLHELEDDSGRRSGEAAAQEPGDLVDLRSLGADPPGTDLSHPSSLEQDFDTEARQIYVGHEEEPEVEEATAAEDASAVEDAAATEREAVVAEEAAAAEDLAGIEDAADADTAAAVVAQQDAAADVDARAESDSDAVEWEAASPLERAESAYAAEDAALTKAAAAAGSPVDSPGVESAVAGEVTFAREPRRWWVGVVALLGLLALAAQIFWYQFESWGRDPTLRPIYAQVCKLAGCELPVLRDLDALRTEKLLVRSHPEFADALIVDTVIVNEAPFAQPFPALDLRFTTIDGTLVAGRLFQPEEYLAGDLAGATMMAPNTPVRLALELKDPGGDAVSYFLSFR